jgi:hypothetical protein
MEADGSAGIGESRQGLGIPGGLHSSSWSRVILSDTSAQSDLSDWIVCQIKY